MKAILGAAVVLSLAACKPPQPSAASSGASVKDFAADAAANNFAVVFGHDAAGPRMVADDVLRYANYLNTGYLGNFKVAFQNGDATSAGVLGALSGLKAQMQANSSLLIAFTGAVQGGKLVLKDRAVSFDEIADALGVKVARLYLMLESPGLTPKAFAAQNGSKIGNASAQVVEVHGFAANSGTSYHGRLSGELPDMADNARQIFLTQKKSPTIRALFNSVLASTQKYGKQAEVYASDPKVFDASVFPQSLLNRPAVQAGPTVAASATIEWPAAFDADLIDKDGTATKLSAMVKGHTGIVIKLATKWCVPCAKVSADLEENADFQAALAKQNIAFIDMVMVPKAEREQGLALAAIANPDIAKWQDRFIENKAQQATIDKAIARSYTSTYTIPEFSDAFLSKGTPAFSADHCPFLSLYTIKNGSLVALAGPGAAPSTGVEEVLGYFGVQNKSAAVSAAADLAQQPAASGDGANPLAALLQGLGNGQDFQ